MEDKNCQFIEKCKYHKYLENYRQNLLGPMENLYCKTLWKRCKRFQMRIQGLEVPDDMWPTGMQRKIG